MRKILLLLTIMLFPTVSFAEFQMNQEVMESIVKSMALEAKGEKGIVEFSYSNIKMYLISDTGHDRMRIIAPITEYKKLTQPQIDSILESNFHKSLDARYAVSEGVLYSAYIHPLSELSQPQLKSAVHQVVNLALTFGQEYTSGILQFGGNK